jgi:hypothetical protein
MINATEHLLIFLCKLKSALYIYNFFRSLCVVQSTVEHCMFDTDHFDAARIYYFYCGFIIILYYASLIFTANLSFFLHIYYFYCTFIILPVHLLFLLRIYYFYCAFIIFTAHLLFLLCIYYFH